jgi:hypothetical protein
MANLYALDEIGDGVIVPKGGFMVDKSPNVNDIQFVDSRKCSVCRGYFHVYEIINGPLTETGFYVEYVSKQLPISTHNLVNFSEGNSMIDRDRCHICMNKFKIDS